jgi:hypothetical protein
MHVRAYNYWVSLLGGRAYPSINDLVPANLDDFGPHSVLLDFTGGAEDPAIAFVGRALKTECRLHSDIRFISEVPSRSLLSRLTDHYLQIIANCAPIGFEAEFVSQAGVNTMYRGILMPLSSNGDTIDFIYGVINWKEVADTATVAGITGEAARAKTGVAKGEACAVWADGPNSSPLADGPFGGGTSVLIDDGLDFGYPYDEAEAAGQGSFVLDPDAGLADRLCAARETAEAVKSADVRSRGALYRALGQAYDFALAAEQAPEDFAEILDDAGLKAQARAPMTPIVKLIFGIDYDKTRLTEFAAALAYGRRENVAQGGLQSFLETFPGALKGVVGAERKARRPEPAVRPDGRDALRRAEPVATLDLAIGGEEEFVLLVARREQDGSLSVLAPVTDAGLLDRAIRRAAA